MVFISGSISGYYRAQNVIKALSDNKVRFVFIPQFLNIDKWGRVLKLIIAVITWLVFFPSRIVSISLSSTVFVLPMNMDFRTLFDVFIAKIFRKKVIYDFYVSAYDSYVIDRKIYNEGSLSARKVRFLDIAFTYLADIIICLNTAEKNYYSKFMHHKALSKIVMIPLVIDSHTPTSSLHAKNFDSSIKFCWWGTYVPLHGLERIIDAFSQVSNKQVKLYIFGDKEAKSEKFRLLAEELNIAERVVFNHDFTFSNGRLPEFLLKNNVVCLGTFGDSEKARTVLVNKVIDSALLKLPMLTMKTKATSEFFEHNKNIIFSSNESRLLAEVIDDVINAQYDLKQISKNSYETYLHNFTPKVFSKKLLKILGN